MALTLKYFKDSEAAEVTHAYKDNHELIPARYAKDFHLLNEEAMIIIQDDLSTDIKLKIDAKSMFVEGDGSKEDLQYQAIRDSWKIE